MCSVLAWTLSADGGQDRASFEVAAIRPVQLGAGGTSVGIRIQGDQLRVGGYTLRDLLIAAYRVRPYQVVGGPDWIGEDRFDVQASRCDREASAGHASDAVERTVRPEDASRHTRVASVCLSGRQTLSNEQATRS